MTTAHLKNTGVVTPGNSITFDIKYRLYTESGLLVNLDNLPTVIITDPTGNVLDTALGTYIDTGHYEYTFTCPTTALLSSDYKITWVGKVNGDTVPNAFEVFTVSSTQEVSIHDIIISDSWLHLIKKIIAYPKVDDLFLTDDEIKSYAIFPAMHEYFTKFPIKVPYETPISGEIIIPFPDTFTYSVVSCNIVDTGLSIGTGTSFWDLVAFQSLGGVAGAQGAGSFGKRGYNPNSLYQERLLQRMAIKSYQNTYMTTKWRVDKVNKQLIAYASSAGTLAVMWAKYSNNFDNDVMYTRQLEVIQLAQANLLDHLCDTSYLITDSSLDQQLNTTEMRTRATELREKVITKWDETSDIVLIHAT